VGKFNIDQTKKKEHQLLVTLVGSMNSIRGFHTTIICYGRPFKRRNSLPIIHAAEKPAAKADIDFSALGT
jgi:hypothetical protein